jgi:chromosome partitioning protein
VNTKLREHFGELVFNTSIPKNVSLEEAHSRHTHIFAHAPSSAGAHAYRDLVKEVLSR